MPARDAVRRGRVIRQFAGFLDTDVWVRLSNDGVAGGEEVMSAREEVLLRCLIDWIALERVHSRVARESAGQPLAVIQDKVLDLIRSLVTDGLCELGDLATADHCFGAWDAPLDESIERIRDVYVNQFDEDSEWWFYCWLKLTPEGRELAEAIEASQGSTQHS